MGVFVQKYSPLKYAAILLALLPPLYCSAADVLHIASDDWCPYVCASSEGISGGYLVELVGQALAFSGYQAVPLLLPLKRAMTETSEGRLEGVYAPPIDERLRMSDILAYSRACFYTRTDNSWTYQGMASLQSLTVGIVDGYGYDNGAMDAYVLKNHGDPAKLEIARGENAGLNNLQKLYARRFNVMLEHEAVIPRLLLQAGVNLKLRQAGCLEQSLPLMVGFNKQDINSKNWVKALREGVLHLRHTGELDALRQHYGMAPENLKN
jgi:polar amino acid transport system substrate-binding protein